MEGQMRYKRNNIYNYHNYTMHLWLPEKNGILCKPSEHLGSDFFIEADMRIML